MAHRLGSLVPVSPARQFRPGVGVNAGGNTWEDTFTAPAPPIGTSKFLILHFQGVTLNAGDRLEVPLGNGETDVFTDASGPGFWTRPIKGGSVAIRFVDAGSGVGTAPLTEFGRGEGIVNNGVDATAGGNANGDVFLIDSPYVDPPHFNPFGVCPPGARHWQNVDCLPPGVMRDVARSVGIFLEVGEGKVSSCSAALIGPDLILTAAHCVSADTVIPSGSFTLDYETDCTGNRPAAYSPKFHKLKRLVRAGWATQATGAGLVGNSGLDYAIVQIETPLGGLGVPPLPMRPDLPPVGEEVFLIHHPRGATKKVSRKPLDPECEVKSNTYGQIRFGGDLDNGSSGSPLFDLAGRLIGVNDWAATCNNGAQATATILADIATTPPPPTDIDVVLVLDRSGSMSLTGASGSTKMEEARKAASLFADLVRMDRTHQLGLATFSTTAQPAFGLALVNAANKDVLIGPPPNRNGGVIGGVAANGSTTIGGGLRQARQQLTASPSGNTPAILLLTDGLQNTPPMISDVEAELGSTRLGIIGFGTEGQLDGPLLTRLARNHGGLYQRSEEVLRLKKLFVLFFGNLFHTGIQMDPFFVFPAGATATTPMPLEVCGEERITVVLSWQAEAESLHLNLITPAGSTLTAATPGVFSSSGSTWVYFRVELPFNGERDGTWQVKVTRSEGPGEFFPHLGEEPFFVTAIADGGPYLKPVFPTRLYYTGDALNPQVILREPSGHLMDDASVTVEIETPDDGTGNILTREGLRPPILVDGDQLDARTSTLVQLEQARGERLVTTTAKTFPLFDDGERDGDGALEPDGMFGNPLTDLLRQEGNYSFHARARYGHECKGTREAIWSIYVSVGIDPGNTIVTSSVAGTGPDGCVIVRTTLTPRDRFGNHLGPGRAGAFEVSGQPGSGPMGAPRDNGDGSYVVDVCWDPESGRPPGIIVNQPDRPPIGLPVPVPEGSERYLYSVKFLCGVQAEDNCGRASLRPGSYATEINIHNFQDTEVRIEKHVLPVVLVGAVAGREPRFVGRKESDRIVLPPHTATMDDCCRLAELLFGAPGASPTALTIGFLEIVSNRPVGVTAVYTVSDPKSAAVSIDVEQIESRRTR